MKRIKNFKIFEDSIKDPKIEYKKENSKFYKRNPSGGKWVEIPEKQYLKYNENISEETNDKDHELTEKEIHDRKEKRIKKSQKEDPDGMHPRDDKRYDDKKRQDNELGKHTNEKYNVDYTGYLKGSLGYLTKHKAELEKKIKSLEDNIKTQRYMYSHVPSTNKIDMIKSWEDRLKPLKDELVKVEEDIKSIKQTNKTNENTDQTICIPIETIRQWIDRLDETEISLNQQIYVKDDMQKYLNSNIIKENSNIDGGQKKIIIEFTNGDKFELLASVIALNRVKYYAEREDFLEGSDEWNNELKESMKDDELYDWIGNNIDWSDIKNDVTKIESDSSNDYDDMWSDVTIKIK